jgi:hypothetical protein
VSVRVLLDRLDGEWRAIAARFWRAHRLPRLDDLSPEQEAVAREWLEWVLHEGDGWPQPEPVELPPVFDHPVTVPPPMPDDAVLHECGPVLRGYGMRYRRWLCPGEECSDCGHDPGLTTLDEFERRLRACYGDDAGLAARALARRFEQEVA